MGPVSIKYCHNVFETNLYIWFAVHDICRYERDKKDPSTTDLDRLGQSPILKEVELTVSPKRSATYYIHICSFEHLRVQIREGMKVFQQNWALFNKMIVSQRIANLIFTEFIQWVSLLSWEHKLLNLSKISIQVQPLQNVWDRGKKWERQHYWPLWWWFRLKNAQKSTRKGGGLISNIARGIPNIEF